MHVNEVPHLWFGCVWAITNEIWYVETVLLTKHLSYLLFLLLYFLLPFVDNDNKCTQAGITLINCFLSYAEINLPCNNQVLLVFQRMYNNNNIYFGCNRCVNITFFGLALFFQHELVLCHNICFLFPVNCCSRNIYPHTIVFMSHQVQVDCSPY